LRLIHAWIWIIEQILRTDRPSAFIIITIIIIIVIIIIIIDDENVRVKLSQRSLQEHFTLSID